MKILIIDDERVELETLRRGLFLRADTVVSARSAMEAMRLLEQSADTIDVVITDYLMPCVNGIEFVRLLRREKKTVPVIMVSAYATGEAIMDALTSGCTSFLLKPFTLERLFAEIDKVTGRTKTNARQESVSVRQDHR